MAKCMVCAQPKMCRRSLSWVPMMLSTAPKKNITKDLEPASYDVIFDTSGKYSYFKLRYAIKSKGSFVSTIPSITAMPPFSMLASLSGKHSKSFIVNCNSKDLDFVGELMKG
eukprot:414788_1